ncbi:MAG TPA: ATP-binding protein [Terriglobales bacterium]|jgi:two-component system cell cycle sensor histidine kinase/response regulator CckA|nr:ATP-binding protein [Terriglobales bacterium]
MNVLTQLPAAYDYDRDHRLRAMFEEAAIGIGICQLDGQILEANPALSRLLGYTSQELAGTHACALALGTGNQPHSSPGPILEQHDSSPDSPPSAISPDQRRIEELIRGQRACFEIEKHYLRKDGSELWGHLTVSLGRDARRQPAFLIALVEDATERRLIKEHLREAEKMEVIGRLAGGIAHDFNNLLTGILLYCDLLTAGLEKNALNNGALDSLAIESGRRTTSELSQHVDEVRMAGEHGAALTHQLLSIARKQSADPRPVRINEIVASTKNLLQRLIGEQIELVLLLDEFPVNVRKPTRVAIVDLEPRADAGLVFVDPAQLRQILLNLVLNARDAMPHGGKIRLTTRATKFPGASVIARRAVALAVTDNGCGMDAATQARLFEPFFTTKNPGRGTGLGLATVQRIVSAAGGVIEVQSEPGRGTSIEVFFPALESVAAMNSIPESSEQDESGSSRNG